jgi:predicted ATPase
VELNRLIIKNFGVLKDIDIKLNKVNLFIGKNSSGKSVLAKLVTIITNILLSEDEIYDKFKDYNIDFISNDTIIKLTRYDKELFTIKNKKILLNNRDGAFAIREKYQINKRTNIQFEKLKLKDEFEKFEDIINEIKKEVNSSKDDLKIFESKYIPAERNLISLFNQSISNFVSTNIPLPKTLLEFSAQYNLARNEIKELSLLDMKYNSKNGKDLIYYGNNEDDYSPLEYSSSGIQTALPLYLTVKYFASKHNNIVIEEPELNLFPQAQVDTIKYIIKSSLDNNTYIMTHSPYILSTLNILLFAFKAGNKNKKLEEEINKIIPKVQWINPDKFSAYYLEDGKARDIKGKTGLISENEIDESSDIIDDEFNELMELYREYK